MLAHRLQRCPSIEQTLDRFLVFTREFPWLDTVKLRRCCRFWPPCRDLVTWETRVRLLLSHRPGSRRRWWPKSLKRYTWIAMPA